jgi:hypothetical protein
LASEVNVKVALRLAVSRQSVPLAPSRLKRTTRDFYFAADPLRLESLRNIFSDEKMGLTIMNRLLIGPTYNISTQTA